MYAVVTSGGKQYRVEAGSEFEVERLAADAGSTITFDRVLLVGDGEDVTVGTPTVQGASVSGTVLGEVLGPKLIVFKFKQKATYRRKNGHRQHLTRVRIDEITASGKGSATATSAAADAGAAEATADAPEKKPAAPKRTTAKAKASKAAAERKADGGEKAAAERKAGTGKKAEKKPAPRKRSTKAKAETAEE